MKTGERDVVLDETLEFLQALWALDHGLQTVSKRMKGELGLTGLQRLVLRILGRNPRLSAGELSRTLHLHPSTLTQTSITQLTNLTLHKKSINLNIYYILEY